MTKGDKELVQAMALEFRAALAAVEEKLHRDLTGSVHAARAPGLIQWARRLATGWWQRTERVDWRTCAGCGNWYPEPELLGGVCDNCFAEPNSL